MNKILHLTLFLFLPIVIFSQTLILKGSVSDKSDKEGLIGVEIVIENTTQGTTTDILGEFTLTTTEKLPFNLVFNYLGYGKVVYNVINTDFIRIVLEEESALLSEVVVSASRVEERILESPVTIEKMDIKAIRNATSADYYDALANMKGVQTTQSSLTFSSVNLRGFGAHGDVRTIQLSEGVDNAAPLLNFPLGSIVGIPELDLRSIEVVPGAGSALYGPNAFNGVIVMSSKSPFEYKGLSAQVKMGGNYSTPNKNNPYFQTSIRYANVVKERFGYKFNVSYLSGTDWLANDYTTGRIQEGQLNPTNVGDPDFDGINLYGDENTINIPMSFAVDRLAGEFAPLLGPIFGYGDSATAHSAFREAILKLPNLRVTRTGFKEEDILDSQDAKSLKSDIALTYKFKRDVNLLMFYRFGTGSTVYEGNERYALRNFRAQSYKLELGNKHFQFRSYLNRNTAGDSYNLAALGGYANERFSPSEESWVPAYLAVYALNLMPAQLQTGSISAKDLNNAHRLARQVADGVITNPSDELIVNLLRSVLDYENYIPDPNSQEFKDTVAAVRKTYFQSSLPGSRFIDASKIFFSEFNINLADKIKFIDIQMGGNYRLFNLSSSGTVLNEDPEGTGTNSPINVNEYGAYLQLTKSVINDKLKFIGSLRYDKNQRFKGQISPRVAVVATLGEIRQHNFRSSYQTGFRNPTNQNQFIFFPTGNAILIGGSEDNAGRYGLYEGGAYSADSYFEYLESDDSSKLKIDFLNYLKPEQVRSVEVGYRGFPTRKLYFDIGAYFNIYKNFIADRNVILKNTTTHKGTVFYGLDEIINGEAPIGTRATSFRASSNTSDPIKTWGVAAQLAYKLPKGFGVMGNYTYSDFKKDPEGDSKYIGFNMPKHKFTVGLSHSDAFIKGFGFDVTYRWQEAFYWQSGYAFGNVPAYGVINAQVSYLISKVKTMVKIGAQNMLRQDYRTSPGGPRVGSIYYLSLTFDEMFK
jgi:iron complex outermembrane recepter protein